MSELRQPVSCLLPGSRNALPLSHTSFSKKPSDSSIRGVLQCGGAHPLNTKSMETACHKAGVPYKRCETIDDAKLELFKTKQSNEEQWNFLWIPSGWVNPKEAPWDRAMIMFGPHTFVLPPTQAERSENKALTANPLFDPSMTRSQVFYNCLSPWVLQMFAGFGPFHMPLVSFPFGLEIPTVERSSFSLCEQVSRPEVRILAYFKHRKQREVLAVQSFLAKRELSAKQKSRELSTKQKAKPITLVGTFHYGTYAHKDFLSALERSDAVVWVGCHESQGFAFQDCLARNKPIFCWDVDSMHAERAMPRDEPLYEHYRQQGWSLSATSASFWNESLCGMRVQSAVEFCRRFDSFLVQVSSSAFSPRSLVLDHLTHEVCFERLRRFVERDQLSAVAQTNPENTHGR